MLGFRPLRRHRGRAAFVPVRARGRWPKHRLASIRLVCPISGRKLDAVGGGWQSAGVSISVSEVEQRLQSVLGLTRGQASRAVDEVLDSLTLEVDE